MVMKKKKISHKIYVIDSKLITWTIIVIIIFINVYHQFSHLDDDSHDDDGIAMKQSNLIQSRKKI